MVGAWVVKVEVEEVLPVGKVEAGEAPVGKMVSRNELSWTGKPTWRGQRSLLNGLLTQVTGIPTQMRGKIGQGSERSSFSVRAVPLLSFYCTMDVFHTRFVPLHSAVQIFLSRTILGA